MAVFSGPEIVNDGLVLHLDAANLRSYSGSGTTWTDLSGNGNNGTLVNGVDYNGSNLGSLVFDGINDYVDMGANSEYNAISSITIEVLFNRTAVGSSFYQVILSNSRDCCSVYNGFQLQISNSTTDPAPLVCVLWNSNNYNGSDWATAFTQMSINSAIGVNTWYHSIFTYDITSSSFRGYINGVLRSSITKLNALSTNQSSFNLLLGKSPSHNAPVTGNISICKIYNRALTAQEIRQNFEALRGRYLL